MVGLWGVRGHGLAMSGWGGGDFDGGDFFTGDEFGAEATFCGGWNRFYWGWFLIGMVCDLDMLFYA